MATILVVEGGGFRSLARLLESHGHRVLHAESAGEGLAFLRCVMVDLVVLEMALSDMSGIEMLRTMRQTPMLQRVPAIVYTAIEDAGAATAAQGLGARFLHKSHDSIESLVDLVGAACQPASSQP
jgi:CheY-like chemotaxis protein